ncbi:BatD family protein [Salinicola sp. CPA57]|uniref:BatD family protein n=1 Tax=Salinicola sp. CPA57 TaxID=1949080 RepID=UPI001E354EBE|nr:BatD family protein [Salinicola sp. CPA57]
MAYLLSALCLASLASAQSTPTLASSLAPQVTATLDPTRVAPGETAQLRITVLVPTFMPRPVAFPSLDQPNLRVQLPERATMPVSRRVDGRTWAGISRRYTLTPLAAGAFSLGEGALEITFQDPETGETVTRTQALTAQTLTAAVPDAAAGLSPYIAGTSLTLEQQLTVIRAGEPPAAEAPATTDESLVPSGEAPVSLAIGDSLEREIKISLEGGSALLLPSLAETTPMSTMAVHAASPVLAETPTGGTRTARLTYIAQHGGSATLPEITVRWFDLGNRRIAAASMPGVVIAIDGAPVSSGGASRFQRQYVTLGIAILLFGAMVAVGWRWLWPIWQRTRQRRRRQLERRGITALTYLERQVRARRFSESLIAWQALQRRVPGLPDERRQTISRCLATLGRERYATDKTSAPSDTAWRDLQQALPRVADLRQTRREPLLPTLNPRAPGW